jgi:hypothetical protein
LAICGFSMSLQFTAYNTVAYDDVPPERTASANSFYTTFQQLMLSFGICTGALALRLSKALTGRAQADVGDFSAAFLIVTAISSRGYPRHTGDSPTSGWGAEMSGRRREGGESEAEQPTQIDTRRGLFRRTASI